MKNPVPRSIALVAAFSAIFNLPVSADDWPQWRGPNRDGISREAGLLKKWPADGPDLIWKADGLGAGYSSIAVADGLIYTIGDFEDGSYVVALNESDGSDAWKTKIGDKGGHKKYPGPRSTPTVDGGEVFAMNQHADVVCLDAKSGKEKWSVNLVDDFGGKMMSGWKYSESPLVDGGRVIVTPGGADGTLLALDRKHGKEVWRTEEWKDAAGYSSVIIATIGGKRQYVQLTGKSVAGIDPNYGKIIWKADREGKTAVITTPVVQDDTVFVTSSYGIGCNAFKVTEKNGKWDAEEIYANREIANHHGGVILHKGHVFGSSGGTWRCLDIETGDLKFAERSAGKGATLMAGGMFILRGENGAVALIKAAPGQFDEISTFKQPDRSSERAWPHPVVANGRLYLRDQDILLAYDVKAK